MPCGCTDSSTTTTPSTITALSPAGNTGAAASSVAVSADFTAGARTSSVQVYAPADSPPASIEIALPLSPSRGQRVTITAVDIPVTVDGNGNTIVSGASIAAGTSRTFEYASDAYVPTATAGQWINIASTS